MEYRIDLTSSGGQVLESFIKFFRSMDEAFEFAEHHQHSMSQEYKFIPEFYVTMIQDLSA